MTPELETLLQAVRASALASKFGTATIKDLKHRLATQEDLLPALASLHALGRITLHEMPSKFGRFWTARPLDPAREIFPVTVESVRRHVEEIISRSRTGRSPPYYDSVRGHFAWMDGAGSDVLRPIFDLLKAEGVLAYGTAGAGVTVDWIEAEKDDGPMEPRPIPPKLSDDDFRVLNLLEDFEAERINFGVFEAWFSAASLADRALLSRESTTQSLGRLSANGWVMLAADGRVRSRMAELAREVRYVKQRFKHDDADRRPYLVRSLKIELRDRDKPERRESLESTFNELAQDVSEPHAKSLLGLCKSLRTLWGSEAYMAAFQTRSLCALTHAWNGNDENAFVIAAETGSGKTEAAALPLIAGAASDRLQGLKGVRAILAYPRVRLATNQAQRLARYLAALAKEPGMPTLTLGLQVAAVPQNFETLGDEEIAAGWKSIGSNEFAFPFFACPACDADLTLAHGSGEFGADQLTCTRCDWAYGGWIGSKKQLREQPPSLFLPTTDSLHQWLHDSRSGRLFGDDAGFVPPRALLADEIHLYTHIHGAQVGYALRRLAARAETNGDATIPILAIGMSATLGDPALAWGRLIDRANVSKLAPMPEERVPNPRGREYFYFVQPEVQSRGQDIAGASTTVQSVMCLAHGMRRRTGNDGGFRTLVFLDSIDKIRRLHAAYEDAETYKKLAAYRTRRYPEDPLTGAQRASCCGQPYGCDVFRDGECWFFAATDTDQHRIKGRHTPGRPIRVADQPIFSGATGRIEAIIKDSDVVFTTSSLEVGYDDPDITLIYQHYAPQNLASFVQRKGRGGRGSDDRPITGVTLSIYSSRDSWWFRKPREMIEPKSFDIPLNPLNHFVRRGQLLATMLDAFARYQRRGNTKLNIETPQQEAIDQASELVCRIFGPDPWKEFGEESLANLWSKALEFVRPGKRVQYLSDIRQNVDWIPNFLFDTINLPQLQVRLGAGKEKPEDIALAFVTAAPGNATRRYDGVDIYWRPPVNGRAPWLQTEDYTKGIWSRPFGDSPAAWLRQLPDDVAPMLEGLSPEYFRPTQLSLEPLGKMFGTGWTSNCVVPDSTRPETRIVEGNILKNRRVRQDSRGSLRGFPVVKASATLASQIEAPTLAPWLKRIDQFTGNGMGGKETGLALAHVYWGADAELNLEGPPSDTAVFSQIFTSPKDNRPLLHGYHVQTEGVRFHLNAESLDAFVSSTMERLETQLPEKRWHAGQMLRFLIESRAQAVGVNAYEARRGAELIVSAAGDSNLKKRLSRLLNFWSAENLAELFEDTRLQLLSQHPLLGVDRVQRVSQSLSDQRFQEIFKNSINLVAQPAAFGRYIKSTVMHGLAARLKELFVQLGRGDDRSVVMHVQLPSQFADAGQPIITICESGAFGDGTTRSFLAHIDELLEYWNNGFIWDCPNAREDDVLRSMLNQTMKHKQWREWNPNDTAQVMLLALSLGLPAGSAIPAAVLHVLYGTTTIGSERFYIYDLALAIESIDQRLSNKLGRAPSAWELTSAVVEDAKLNETATHGQLLRAYAGIEDANLDDSLSPEGRLADQVYRLNARLCVDGCQACVHQASNMMSDSLAESSTSRNLLRRFVCDT